MKEPGIDKVKYYVMQFDHHLDDGISNICSKIAGGEGAVGVQKVCNVICDDLPETDSVEVTVKRQGNLKKAEDEEEEESKYCFGVIKNLNLYSNTSSSCQSITLRL